MLSDKLKVEGSYVKQVTEYVGPLIVSTVVDFSEESGGVFIAEKDIDL